jgi:hypothetical protein
MSILSKVEGPAASEKESEPRDVIADARAAYKKCGEAWRDNRDKAREDLRFARLGEQWPERIRQEREREHRPCLTLNRMPAFIRQVVNDARQNKPSIRVHPQDSGADPKVAEIINGLIRNIEINSDADIAYDTAIEHAVGQGFGFWRINTAYSHDDAFDQDIVIERIANPFTVYGDPRSTAADSSDWSVAFIVSTLAKDEFERDYPEAEKTDWDHDFSGCRDWIDGDDVTVAEYWTREKVRREIVALSDGSVRPVEEVERLSAELTAQGVSVVGEPREVESWKVVQRIMTGAEVLKEVEWAGKYIPIVPVYGDEVIDEQGKRHFRSLIRDARSAQEMFNYWRTTTTELVALAPKAPWIGRKGAFDADANWDTANSASHSKLEYDGPEAPQRQPFAGVPAGALQEALNAADDMKSIIGIYDASLGARSNETSGRAIMARQREGDVSTYHFIDNLSRAIRHGGRILLDLIPKVYTTERMIRVLGEDLKPEVVAIAPTGQPVTRIPDVGAVFDITAGKYDLTVAAGPSFTSRREEAAWQMESLIQKVPDAGMLIGDIYAEALDWPMASKIAERLKLLLPPELRGRLAEGEGPEGEAPAQGGPAPEMQGGMQAQIQAQMQAQMTQMQAGMQAQMAQGAAELQRLRQENQALKLRLQNRSADIQVKADKNRIDLYEAETARMQATKPPIFNSPYDGAAGR